MNISRFIPCILLAALFFVAGCATSTPDPLAGWQFSSLNNLDSNKGITDDYQKYIRNLSPEERKYAGPINYYEDGTGQHAVRITIGLNGTVWRHVLIYGKNDMRIKVIKYASGDYRS